MRTIEQGALRLSAVTSRSKEGARAFAFSTYELGNLARTPNTRRLIQAAPELAKKGHVDQNDLELLSAADQDFYESLDKIFGFSEREETGPEFFTRHMTHAHQQITDLWNSLSRQQARIHGFLAPVPTPHSPAELIIMLNSPHIEEKVRYYLRRNATLALLNAHFEKEEQIGRGKLQNVLATIMSHWELPNIEDVVVYSLHDNETNKVLWVSDSGRPIPDTPNTHLKEHKTKVLDFPTIGKVYYKHRNKPTAGLKAIIKGIINAEEYPERKTLKPIIPSDVHDLNGMQLVVADASTNKDLKVTVLIGKIIEPIMKHFPKARITSKDEPKKDSHKSVMFHQRRYMVELLENEDDDFDDPNAKKVLIEVMFHGKEEHLNNTYELGGLRDEKTGKPNGPAHSITKVKQNRDLLEKLHPSTSRRTDVFPWKETERGSYDQTINALIAMDRLSPDDEEKIRKRYSHAA